MQSPACSWSLTHPYALFPIPYPAAAGLCGGHTKHQGHEEMDRSGQRKALLLPLTCTDLGHYQGLVPVGPVGGREGVSPHLWTVLRDSLKGKKHTFDSVSLSLLLAQGWHLAGLQARMEFLPGGSWLGSVTAL